MMKELEADATVESVWRAYLTTGTTPDCAASPWYESQRLRWLIRRLPKAPRCQLCYFPFAGIGGALTRALIGRAPSRMNPRLCNACESFAMKYKGGAEISLSMLFADVRGSSGLAEGMSPTAFSRLIDRFYRASTGVLYGSHALVEKLIGDEVTALFVPGMAGAAHARVAMDAAAAILRATGHGSADGAWIPVGVGVHTGIAFVGAIGSEESGAEIAALGDDVNTAARLAAEAKAGEIMASEVACSAAGLDVGGLEHRSLQLKGRREPVDVRVVHLTPAQTAP